MKNQDILDGLYALSPQQFEKFVGSLLTRLGYQSITLTGGSGDRGIDLRGYDGDGRLFVVQCKRYAPHSKVRSPELQLFNGAISGARAHAGIYVTTGSLTNSAQVLAKDWDIDLIDGHQLTKLVCELELVPPVASQASLSTPIVRNDSSRQPLKFQQHVIRQGVQRFEWNPKFRGRPSQEVYSFMLTEARDALALHRGQEGARRIEQAVDEDGPASLNKTWRPFGGEGWATLDADTLAGRRFQFERYVDWEKRQVTPAHYQHISKQNWHSPPTEATSPPKTPDEIATVELTDRSANHRSLYILAAVALFVALIWLL